MNVRRIIAAAAIVVAGSALGVAVTGGSHPAAPSHATASSRHLYEG